MNGLKKVLQRLRQAGLTLNQGRYYPNVDPPFIIKIDDSDYGHGAVLTQYHGDDYKVIA